MTNPTMQVVLLRCAFTKQRNSATNRNKSGSPYVMSAKLALTFQALPPNKSGSPYVMSAKQEADNYRKLQEKARAILKGNGAINAEKPCNSPPFLGVEKSDSRNKIISRIKSSKIGRISGEIYLLYESSNSQFSIYVDTDNNTDDVIVLVFIHNVAAFELLVPKSSYDPIKLIELIRSIEL